MTRDQIIETRQALVTQLPVTGEVLRGSLFERTVHHTSGCTICAGAQLRDRSRSVKLRVLEIARAARAKGRQSGQKLAQSYRRLLQATGRVWVKPGASPSRSVTASSGG